MACVVLAWRSSEESGRTDSASEENSRSGGPFACASLGASKRSDAVRRNVLEHDVLEDESGERVRQREDDMSAGTTRAIAPGGRLEPMSRIAPRRRSSPQRRSGSPENHVELAYVDQGYTGEASDSAAARHGIQLEVVKHTQAKRGFVLLPRRWVVERSFASAARFRRRARDYERLRTLAAFHYFVFVYLMLGRIFKMLN